MPDTGFRKRLFGAVFAFLLLFGVCIAKESRVLVVLPARGESVSSQRMNQRVSEVKEARTELNLTKDGLPILRLTPVQGRAAQAFSDIGVEPGERIRVLLCTRVAGGWPGKILAECAIDESPAVFLRREWGRRMGTSSVASGQSSSHEDRYSEKDALGTTRWTSNSASRTVSSQVGILLLFRGSQEESELKPFLAALGKHWADRYGRVRPSPYPLASYDLSDRRVSDGVERAFPELDGLAGPTLALCLFEDGTPTAILQTHSALEDPERLVGVVVEVRREHLSESLSKRPVRVNLPLPRSLEMSTNQERTVSLSRLHELAQQLRRESEGSGESGRDNEQARRALAKILELTQYDASLGEGRWSPELRQALVDYSDEPLHLEVGTASERTQEQLLRVINELLR